MHVLFEHKHQIECFWYQLAFVASVMKNRYDLRWDREHIAGFVSQKTLGEHSLANKTFNMFSVPAENISVLLKKCKE